MGPIHPMRFAGDHDCSTAIRYQRAIQYFERVGDPAGVHYIIYRDGIAHLRLGMLTGPGATGNSGFGELCLGGAVLRHVGSGNQCVISGHCGAVGLLIVRVP